MGELKDDNNGDATKTIKVVGGETIERKQKDKKKKKPATTQAEGLEADAHHGGGEKKKEEDGLTATNTIVLKLDLHCDDCAHKIRGFINNYNGVEQVKGDSAGGILTVIGKVDPNWLRAKVEKKTQNKVELVHLPVSSHQPAITDSGDKKTDDDKTHKKKSDEKSKVKKGEDKKIADGDGDEVKLQEDKLQEDKVKHKRQGDQINQDNHNNLPKQVLGSTAVLKIPLHCADCAMKIRRILKKIDGIKNVSMDNEKDLVTLQGTMDMMELTPFLKRRLKRKVDIVSLSINDNSSSGSEGEKKGKESTTGDNVIDKTAACHVGDDKKETTNGVNKEKKEKGDGGGGDDKKVIADGGKGGVEKKEKESSGANKKINEGGSGEGKKEKDVDKGSGGGGDERHVDDSKVSGDKNKDGGSGDGRHVDDSKVSGDKNKDGGAGRGKERHVDDSKVIGDKDKDGGGGGGVSERRADDSIGGGDKGKAKIEEPKVEVSKMEYQGYGTPYTYYANHNYANQGYDLSTMHDPRYYASTSYVVEYNDPHHHHLHHLHQPQIPPPPPTYLPPPHDHILSDENPNACSVM